ncbi:MAG TPA: hypothetical protein VE819_00560 [Steroidobacteraceae bacterium]|jgi:hypothetical protein|nr:hypothetical protein [Steroidobacteraceae bacterium]
MLLVALIALGTALSFVLLRHLPLIIRASALVLLSLMMMFILLCFWPAFRLVDWIRRADRKGTPKQRPDVAAPALGQPDRRIPHSGW